MALFSQPQSFVGIDLGAGNIKLVELRNEKGRPRLVTYGTYEVPLEKITTNDWSTRKPEAVSALKELLKQAHVTTNLAVSALPTFSVFSSLISIPALAEKDLENVIRLEAKKVIPLPIDQMILDWKEVGKTDKQDSNTQNGSDTSNGALIKEEQKVGEKRILLTAAPKNLVDAYVTIFKSAGLRLLGLETEALALSRALIGRDPSVIMVVDIGAKTTNLSIVEQGIPLVNRGVNFGGEVISNVIAQRMNIKASEAEQWKRDFSIISNQQSSLSQSLSQIMGDVLHEIQYLFQLYRSQFSVNRTGGNGIEKVVLAGGSAFVPGLANFLAQQLNVPVHLGDPWARIVYPQDLHDVLTEIGPAMAVSAGLASRFIESK